MFGGNISNLLAMLASRRGQGQGQGQMPMQGQMQGPSGGMPSALGAALGGQMAGAQPTPMMGTPMQPTAGAQPQPMQKQDALQAALMGQQNPAMGTSPMDALQMFQQNRNRLNAANLAPPTQYPQWKPNITSDPYARPEPAPESSRSRVSYGDTAGNDGSAAGGGGSGAGSSGDGPW